MPVKDRAWSSDWAVGLRVWVERDGRAVLGKGRLEILEAIGRWHSISEAARQTGMAYRTAWLLVQSINEAAGEPLVVAATGGSHGGGARLTPRGQAAVTVFRELQERLQRTAAGLLPRLVQSPTATAIHVAAAVSLEEVLGRLLADYALRKPAVRVRAVFGGSDELTDQILAGAPADLLLTADPRQLDRLEAAQLIAPRSRIRLAENTLAAVAEADSTLRVRRPQDLLKAGVERIALADPSCPLGGYTRDYLKGLDLYDAVSARAVRVDNSRAVVAAVRGRAADLGLVYGSDAVASGCRLLLQVRRPKVPIRYVAARLAHGGGPVHAQGLLEFLGSPAAARTFRRCGFLPPRRARG
jgi:molybdenum ABC transporter molybdate-binding protein